MKNKPLTMKQWEKSPMDKKLDKKEVMWLMTQSDTHQVRKTFKDYKITEFKVYRAVTKTYTTELIIKNY